MVNLIFATVKQVLLLLILLFAFCADAQTDEVVVPDNVQGQKVSIDTSSKAVHSPKKAALLSLIPGGGQVYNKKYWKVPLIYAAGGASIYFASENYKLFQTFRNTLISRVDSTSQEIDAYPLLTDEGVASEMETHQKNFELLVIASIAVYAIQIVDATVDAHLMHFDVSKDLSLKVEPTFFNLQNLALKSNENKPALGLSLKLHLK